MIEVWKDIPGFEGKYQVNTEGSVARMLPSGKRRLLKASRRSSKDKKYYVYLYLNGKRHQISLLHIVSRTFLGPAPKGYVAYYKNECASESHINNIGYMSRKEYNRKIGKKGKRSVCKIDKYGEIVDYYPSISEAAKQNNYSCSGISERVRGRKKGIFASDGYAYCYDDNDHGMKMLIRKIKKGNGNA